MAALMFGLGTTLTRADFVRVLKHPRAAVVGLCCQLLLVPLIGFIAANAFGLSPVFAVGLMIVAACPGGILSNLVTWIARGDSALSISLTAVTSCLSLVALPAWLTWATGHYLGASSEVVVEPAMAVGQVALLTLIPVLLGLQFRARWPERSVAMERPFKIGGLLFMALTVLALIASRRGSMAADVAQVAPAVLALHLGTLAIGLLAGWAARLPRQQVVTVTLETGIQNAALGMTVAASLLGSAELAVPSAVYGLLMFKTSAVGIVAARWWTQERKLEGSNPKPLSQR